MKYIVYGIDGRTGLQTQLHLDASDIADARAVAYRDGVIAEKVLPVQRGALATGGKVAYSLVHALMRLIVVVFALILMVGGILGIFAGANDAQWAQVLVACLVIGAGWFLLVKAWQRQNP